MSSELKTTVISLHGIRTRGQWQKDLQAALEDGGFHHRALDFGFFRAISLINPWARERKVRWFLEQYTQIRATTKGPISIIAHSFGSYIVATAMRKYRQIEFDRIILCGSIVPVNYDWDSVIHKRGQAKDVLNQYGKQDIWVRLAEWAVATAGPSGYQGFGNVANGRVVQQAFLDYAHSEYFFDLNFRDNWVPFLQGKGVRPQYNLTSEGTNWKFRILVAFLLLCLFGVLYTVYLYPIGKLPYFQNRAAIDTAESVPGIKTDSDSSSSLGLKPVPSGSTVTVPSSVMHPKAGNVPAGSDLTSAVGEPKGRSWTSQIFEKIEGEWQARNTYPPQQPPAALFCTVVISYTAQLKFTEMDTDSISGAYEIHETRTVSAAIQDANAPATCNTLLSGNPEVGVLEIDRKANINLMAIGDSGSDLFLKSEFYECKIRGISNCPPSEIGTYPNIQVRILGNFDRILINDMNFSR